LETRAYTHVSNEGAAACEKIKKALPGEEKSLFACEVIGDYNYNGTIKMRFLSLLPRERGTISLCDALPDGLAKAPGINSGKETEHRILTIQ
jgi:hypothetical protein